MIDPIIREAKKYLKNFDESKVVNAYKFAEQAHEGQKRFSGDPYITHPVESTKILMTLKPDVDTICACLLHDVPEETNFTLFDIKEKFSENIGGLVEGFCQLSKVHVRGIGKHDDIWRRMVFSLVSDIRVVLIKFAERLHNLQTLEYVKVEKQMRIAKESLNVYCPILSRLGIYRLKTKMEDICFRYIFPKDYENVSSQVKDLKMKRQNFLNLVTNELHRVLNVENIKDVQISSRKKHLYSIYSKMKRKNKGLVSDLYDVFGIRIILRDQILSQEKGYDDSRCYAVLGIVHKYFTPLTQRFKDYIAVPKENGYKSLHTSVMGIGERQLNMPTEIQIRTQRMHEEAEWGVAAHWAYKQGENNALFLNNKPEFIRSIGSLRSYIDKNSDEEYSIEDLKIDVFHDRIFVVTPHGDVHDLPKGATPVDFAYSVHTDIGHRYRGAKVNGGIVPLDYNLRNGDVIEILVGNKESPNLYWLSSVVTSNAKSGIKMWFRRHDKDKLLAIGRELLNKHLLRHGLEELDPHLKYLANVYDKKISYKDREFILEEIGKGVMNPKNIIRKILENEERLPSKKQKQVTKPSIAFSKLHSKAEILVRGEKGYLTRPAHCCNPKVGDDIQGYITQKQVITIHRSNCPFILKLDERRKTDKLVIVSWDIPSEEKYNIQLRIDYLPKIEILSKIFKIFTECKVQLKRFEQQDKQTLNSLNMVISADDFDRIQSVFDRIENLEEVKKVVQY